MSSPVEIACARTGRQVVVADKRFDWCVGFLLGLPIAVPAPPLYLIGLACFFVSLVRFRLRPQITGIWRELAILALIFIALFSNLVGLTSNDIDSLRILNTSLFFLLFMFARCIVDKRALLMGFCQAMLIWAALIVLMAVYLRIWESGLLLFSVPSLRLWGADIFPDWPNYIAFMLSLSFLLNVTVFGRPLEAVLILVAALLTTSRTPLIALALLIASLLILKLVRVRLGTLLALGAVLLIMLLLLQLEVNIDSEFLRRLFIFEDRDEIYGFALGLVHESPWIGYGSVLLDESIGFTGHPSFHNSYLDIAVRHGLPALVIFLLLLTPPRGSWRQGGLSFTTVVLFVLVGSIFQNFLKHPHILMLYAVLIQASPLFRRPRSEP